MPPNKKKSAQGAQDEASSAAKESRIVPFTSPDSEEELARTRSEKRKAAQKDLRGEDPETSLRNDKEGAAEKELALVLKQLEAMKREKERMAQELEAQSRAEEKIKKLKAAKEQLARLQEELEELNSQQNSEISQNLSPRRPLITQDPQFDHGFGGRDLFFSSGNQQPTGICVSMAPTSSLSLGLQTAPWPANYKMVSLTKFNGQTNP